MENPISIANFFVNKSLFEGVELSPMKLLKLVYLSHGWNLGLKGEALLTEGVQAWKYGPVVKSVYDSFRKYKDGQINSLCLEIQTGTYILPESEDVISLLNKIWSVYKDYSGLELSTLTHEKDSPWDIVWNHEGGKNKMSAIIRNDLIAAYYQKKAEHN